MVGEKRGKRQNKILNLFLKKNRQKQPEIDRSLTFFHPLL